QCGKKAPKKLSLSVRTFKCVFCGNTMDRDHNAAQNILKKHLIRLLKPFVESGGLPPS
ncbi:transposase, partial [Candidatus Poribacteria bacterium]